MNYTNTGGVTIPATGYTTIGYSCITPEPKMKAYIELTNKTSLTAQEFRAKIEKWITKLETKFKVTEYNVELD